MSSVIACVEVKNGRLPVYNASSRLTLRLAPERVLIISCETPIPFRRQTKLRSKDFGLAINLRLLTIGLPVFFVFEVTPHDAGSHGRRNFDGPLTSPWRGCMSFGRASTTSWLLNVWFGGP